MLEEMFICSCQIWPLINRPSGQSWDGVEDNMEFQDAKFIVFPCHWGGHWGISVFVRQINTVFYMDSLIMSKFNRRDKVNKVERALSGFLGFGLNVVYLDTPQQTNGSDCGAHATLNLQLIFCHPLKKGLFNLSDLDVGYRGLYEAGEVGPHREVMKALLLQVIQGSPISVPCSQQPYLETDLNAMDEDTSKDLEVDEDTSKDLQLALDLEKKPPSPVKRDKRKASQIFKPVKAKKQMQ